MIGLDDIVLELNKPWSKKKSELLELGCSEIKTTCFSKKSTKLPNCAYFCLHHGNQLEHHLLENELEVVIRQFSTRYIATNWTEWSVTLSLCTCTPYPVCRKSYTRRKQGQGQQLSYSCGFWLEFYMYVGTRISATL